MLHEEVQQGVLGSRKMDLAALDLLQVAQRSLDGGQRRADFVGHRVEQRLAEPLGFSQQPRLLGLLTQPLPVQGQGNLLGKGIQQVPLLDGRREGCIVKMQAHHAKRVVARHHREEECLGLRDIAGELAGGLAVLEHPRR